MRCLTTACALLLSVLAVEARKHGGHGTRPQLGDRIAVVGGGVHGLLTARLLARKGYSRVKVFEKGSKLCGFTDTLTLEGKVFDLSTRYIAADTVNGAGLSDTFREIFTEYGLEQQEQIPTTFYNAVSQEMYPAPLPLLPYLGTPEGRAALATHLVLGFELLKSIDKVAQTPQEVIDAGFVTANETWGQYAERLDLPGFTEYIAFAIDGFLNGPAREQSAAYVLNSRVEFMPSSIKALLKGAGITSSTPGIPFSDEMKSMLDSDYPHSFYTVKSGYQGLFDRMAAQENFEFCLDCGVTDLKYKRKCSRGRRGRKVRVVTGQGKGEVFDHVIISTRPYQSTPFMASLHEARELLSRTVAEPVGVWLFNGTGEQPAMLGNPYESFIYPYMATATSDATKGHILGVAKGHADSNVLIAIGYIDTSLTEAEMVDRASSDLLSFGIPVAELLTFKQYQYLAQVPVSEVADGWISKFDALQGVANTYYIGEIFSGPTVPAAIKHAKQFVEKYF